MCARPDLIRTSVFCACVTRREMVWSGHNHISAFLQTWSLKMHVKGRMDYRE